ncbi:MAG: hypothetical protein R3352_00370 [Salinisphaeraceae bacterium]|nr:hypothetical protein [Salinisphaeraceae bacterium]
MAIQEIIKDAQDRVEVVNKRAQAAGKAAQASGTKVVDITRKSATKLADRNSKAAKDAYEALVASINKAREAGVKEVAAKPAEFLPTDIRDLAVAAYNDSSKLLTKTGQDLQKAAKQGVDKVRAELTGAKKAPVKKAAPKAAAAKKPAAKKAPAKKAAPKAAA